MPLGTARSRILVAPLTAIIAHIAYGTIYSIVFYKKALSIVGLGMSPEKAAMDGLIEWLQMSLACCISVLICQIVIEKWCKSMAARELSILLIASSIPIYIISWLLFLPSWSGLNGVWIDYGMLFKTSSVACGVPFLLIVNLVPRLRKNG